MIRKCVATFAAALALSVLTVPARAAVTDPVATARQFVDGFNRGDSKTELGACAEATGIIDDFAPHAWMSCASWANAYAANAKQNGITAGTVVLGKPLHDDVTGDVAYVVFPATFTFRQKGKSTSQDALFTFVVKKAAGGWQIVAWAWSNK